MRKTIFISNKTYTPSCTAHIETRTGNSGLNDRKRPDQSIRGIYPIGHITTLSITKMRVELKCALVGLFMVSTQALSSQTTDSIPSRDYSGFDFKLGGGIGMGMTYMKSLDDFKDVKNDYWGLDVNYLVSYNRLIYNFHMVLGIPESRGTYSNDQLIILEDSIIDITSLENSIGYLLLDNRKYVMYPWVGICSTSLSQESLSETNEGPFRSSIVGGCTLGYRIGCLFLEKNIQSFELRTRIAYNHLQYFRDLNMSNIRIGVSLTATIRKVERKKRIDNNR